MSAEKSGLGIDQEGSTARTGAPASGQIRKWTVPEVLPLVRAYYALPGNSVGGSLHIVLDDKNVADSDVEHCIAFAVERGDVEGEQLARVLRDMSRTQRLKLSRMR